MLALLLGVKLADDEQRDGCQDDGDGNLADGAGALPSLSTMAVLYGRRCSILLLRRLAAEELW
jgi:hypothetical protein